MTNTAKNEVPKPMMDPAIRVRENAADPEAWSIWNITQNLTDRWGEINTHDAANKPLEELTEQPELLERLRSQMFDEQTFVVRKDEVFGLLVEVEFMSRESEPEEESPAAGGNSPYKPHDHVIRALAAYLAALRNRYPGVPFCVPEEAHIVNHRPALWALLTDGQLDKLTREALGDATRLWPRV